MRKLNIDDLDVKGKRVLMRVDFNVPQAADGSISNDMRIRKALPSIQAILKRGGRLILMSHFGRPKAQEPIFRMNVVAKRLSELLGRPVKKLDEVVGPALEKAAAAMGEGDVILLENLRFHKGEKDGDPAFARQIASVGDVYVSDAFGTAHNTDASVAVVPALMPKAAAGYLMMKEMDFLGRALNHPQHPYFAILGGAKVSDKIKVIRSLLQRVDGLIVGGAMAYPFLKAQGKGVGASKCDPADVPLAADLLREIGAKGRVLLLPVDHVVARKVEDNAETRVVDDQIPDGWIGLDIGPKTVRLFCDRLRKARMVVWNGPMGFFEKDCFAAGTRAVAEALASSDAVTIVGGGDTATAVEEMGLGDKMSHVSTGGGASLAFLQGDELPGIAGLTDVKD